MTTHPHTGARTSEEGNQRCTQGSSPPTHRKTIPTQTAGSKNYTFPNGRKGINQKIIPVQTVEGQKSTAQKTSSRKCGPKSTNNKFKKTEERSRQTTPPSEASLEAGLSYRPPLRGHGRPCPDALSPPMNPPCNLPASFSAGGVPRWQQSCHAHSPPQQAATHEPPA